MMEEEAVTKRKGRKNLIFSIISLLISASIFGGIPLLDKYRQEHPVDKECVLKSAEIFESRSGTRGIATSGTELKINTVDCGTVYVGHFVAPKKMSYQDMVGELNQYKGQVVTLIFPPFQWPATRDTVLEGYGYRL